TLVLDTGALCVREIEDGFLLHRVSFSQFVTYTINLSGQFKKKACTEIVMPMSCSNQTIFPPFENDNGKADQEYCLGEYGVKKPRQHWITYLSAAFDQSLFIAENKDCVQEIWQQHYIVQWNARSMKPRRSEYTSVVNCYKQEIRTLTIRTAHHTDLIAATKEQRRQEVDVIEKWISEYYSFFKTRRARKVKEQNNH
ncbi:unnamed protein product, partial [Brassica rapa]